MSLPSEDPSKEIPLHSTQPKSPKTDIEPQLFTRLSREDLVIVWQTFGLPTDNGPHLSIPTQSFLYPPKGLPEGLYKRVIHEKTICQYKYYFVSTFFNIALILQLLLGATMTALGSSITNNNTVLVVLAAINTMIAGFLALMHNSGLPERYKNDGNEFDEVENTMKELMETGILKKGVVRDEAIEECFEMYRQAKKTISKNKPAAYATTIGQSNSKSPEHMV